LDKLVLVGGPDDGVITPWESAHFEFYDENDKKDVIPLKESQLYKEDSIGLKKLDEDGKLKVVTFKNVHHVEWHINPKIIQEAILPHLD
jgi:palmitoyl-protein thioesterase